MARALELFARFGKSTHHDKKLAVPQTRRGRTRIEAHGFGQLALAIGKSPFVFVENKSERAVTFGQAGIELERAFGRAFRFGEPDLRRHMIPICQHGMRFGQAGIRQRERRI